MTVGPEFCRAELELGSLWRRKGSNLSPVTDQKSFVCCSNLQYRHELVVFASTGYPEIHLGKQKPEQRTIPMLLDSPQSPDASVFGVTPNSLFAPRSDTRWYEMQLVNCFGFIVRCVPAVNTSFGSGLTIANELEYSESATDTHTSVQRS